MPAFSAKSKSAPLQIAFVLFDRTKLIDVTGPLQVFSDARLGDGGKAYQVKLVSELGGAIITDTGVPLETARFEICRVESPDTLLVSGGRSALEAANSPALQAFVSEMSGRCRRLGSICLGAFILARGGYLNGRRATTHWANCADFQRQFPDVDLRGNSIFEEDEGVWTSAGVTSGIDMALAMVEQDLGRTEALRLAKSLVLYVRRTGGQRQFSSALARQVEARDAAFDTLVSDVLASLGSDLSVPRLAEMAHMSERNFSRKFTETMGISPARFVEEMRVNAACEAIQRGEATLSELPALMGFGNSERMRRAFQRKMGIAPYDYKARFGR